MEPISALLLIKKSADTLKSAFDSVSSLRDAFKNDNKTSQELSAIEDRLSSVRGDLISAQERIQSLQSQLSSESNRVSLLEKELSNLKEIRADLENYSLFEIIRGKFVLTPKESMGGVTPSHYVCVHCSQNGVKSILQTETKGSFEWLNCHNCQSKIELKAPTGGVWSF